LKKKLEDTYISCQRGLGVPDWKTLMYREIYSVYSNKKTESTIHFLDEILDTFYFPIQYIQTNWGTEFFNYSFQYELHEPFIKYSPIKPRDPPHLNDKVERIQQLTNPNSGH